MKIAIGTENQAKVSAVKDIVTQIFGNEVEFYTTKTDSQVRDQPLSDEEGILGAINRAYQSINKFNSDYGVGLEGFAHENKYGMFMGGAVN